MTEQPDRMQTLADPMDIGRAQALAATLGDMTPIEVGDPLPPFAHHIYFWDAQPPNALGRDGHPAKGSFIPDLGLPRRMWAGSRLRFAAPLRIGRRLRKRSEVVAVQSKQGRSGALVFVTVRHQLFDGDTLGIDEEHDIVYREAPAPGTEQPKLIQALATSEFSREICASPVLLFRYSALTFNGHRIHYDQPFCTTTEGYDGLVVHGPLLATLLLDLLRRQLPQAQVTAFHFRALATIFDGETFTLHGTRGVQDGTFQLWAQRPDGALAMQAEAQIQ